MNQAKIIRKQPYYTLFNGGYKCNEAIPKLAIQKFIRKQKYMFDFFGEIQNLECITQMLHITYVFAAVTQ